MSTFGFEIRFQTPAGRAIRGVDTENELALAMPGIAQPIALHQLPHHANHTPGAPEWFVIKGAGFPDEAAARFCGEKIKQALAIVGCETRMGIDAGRDRATSGFSAAIQDAWMELNGQQLRDIVHGLDVYADDPPVTHPEGSGSASVFFPVEGFPEKLAVEFATAKPLSTKLSLGLELYNLGHFEPATKARFLNLVTIIEVLAERERREQPIRDQLDSYIQEVRNSGLLDRQKDSLVSGLGNLKLESISAAGRRLVAQNLGDEDSTYFSECYSARSELLHEGKTARPQVNDWGRLDDIVRGVLLRMLRNA